MLPYDCPTHTVRLLRQYQACPPAIAWARKHCYTPNEAYQYCNDPEWLIWFAYLPCSKHQRPRANAAFAAAFAEIYREIDLKWFPRLFSSPRVPNLFRVAINALAEPSPLSYRLMLHHKVAYPARVHYNSRHNCEAYLLTSLDNALTFNDITYHDPAFTLAWSFLHQSLDILSIEIRRAAQSKLCDAMRKHLGSISDWFPFEAME